MLGTGKLCPDQPMGKVIEALNDALIDIESGGSLFLN